MSALYPSWANPLYRGVLLVLLVLPILGIAGLMIYVRTPYNTRQNFVVEQPVQFDHRHHVIDDEIGCLYCHDSAETEASAGVPSADVCMGCHVQIWNQSPLLEPVRRAAFTQRPIAWRRVHALADFVYFHHGVHVQAGLECSACHGDVASMAQVYRVRALQMGFCLDCHQRTAQLRAAASDGAAIPAAPVDGVVTARGHLPGPLTTCTACHR